MRLTIFRILVDTATILPDVAMYQTDDAENAADLAAWSKMVATLLGEAGFDQTAQAQLCGGG